MGIFGQSTPFDADIEKATSETHTNENWSLILDVCDKVSSNPRNAKECLKAIMRRMGHADPHVVMQAITLLDACANNCGKPFHLEVASRDFENEFRRLLSKAQPKVALKMRQVLKNWAENDFKNDPELNLIPSLYSKLRHEGYDFSNLNDKPSKSAPKLSVSKDPNVVNSQQEEEDIAKAIELSLKETKNSPKQQTSGGVSGAAAYPSLYPSFSGSGSLGSITSTGGASNNSTGSQPEPRKVRALYDFEAAEENELTFFAGEIIHVLDDSDPNWWKGFNQRGDGLFPSNFVTADLSVDPERLDINQQNKSKKTVQFEDDALELQQKTEAAAAAAANQRIEIDEGKIDRLLHLLHEANPEDPSQDSDEMLRLEQEVHQMGPLIDAELERVDRKHAQLTQLSSDLVDAINLYHSLMRDDRAAMLVGSGGGYVGGMPGMSGPMQSLGYSGTPNQQMVYGAAGNFGPQSYGGMPSLPYGHPGATATTAVASTIGGPYVGPNNAGQFTNAGQPQIPIPMQFQNGHINSPHLNGGMNAVPPHMSSPMANMHQQQPLAQQQLFAGATQQSGLLPQQQQVPTAQQPPQNYQMLTQLPQQQQQQQQFPMQQTPTTIPASTVAGNMQQPAAQPPTQQQQQQFVPPQHPQHYMPQQPPQQQQQQQQFAIMPNGQQAPYMPATTGVGGLVTTGMPMPNHNNHNHNHNNNNPDQYSHLQQQMAAMSMAGINQPVTQSFLVQNEPKTNIPIYQQQR